MLRWKVAWKNAIKSPGDNPDKWRVCYICGKLMAYVSRWDEKHQHSGGWDLDYLDGDIEHLVEENLVAIHHECKLRKDNADFTDLYLDVKKQENELDNS